MGSPISPIIANMFMEKFEIKALATVCNPPCFWGWYVEDTSTVQKKHHVQGLFEHTSINGQHESIASLWKNKTVKAIYPC